MALQPNILFIMSDQHRADSMSIENHSVVLTPNLDTLGKTGTHFRRAYTTCPSCIPARRALLTGKHPANNGVTGFIGSIPIQGQTLPRALRDAGYQTVLVGRSMHQTPGSARYGYDQVVSGSCYEKEDQYGQELRELTPGINDIHSVGLTNNGWTARPWPHADHMHPTSWIFNQARSFLSRADETAPLFLNVSTYAPHPPLLPPRDYFERYIRTGVPDPIIGNWAKPPAPHENVSIDSARCHLQGEALLSARAGYYGLINHLDDQVYWLKADFASHSGKNGRPWLIVYSSDHGEMLGDHYLFRKCEPYEGSARIPMVITGSSDMGFKPGTVCNSPVCLEDLMPTFLDAAGQTPPTDLDGRSLLPILRGQADSVRETLHLEHSPCYSKQQAFQAITDGKMKFIWRAHTGEEQLFDLTNDPREDNDLLANGQNLALGNKWRQKLIEKLRNRPEGFVEENRLVAGKPWPGTYMAKYVKPA
jgi:arylsulfatase A-like enzyme